MRSAQSVHHCAPLYAKERESKFCRLRASNSLINSVFTENYDFRVHLREFQSQEAPVIQSVTSKFPAQNNSEFFGGKREFGKENRDSQMTRRHPTGIAARLPTMRKPRTD